jgi:hypothetical protein
VDEFADVGPGAGSAAVADDAAAGDPIADCATVPSGEGLTVAEESGVAEAAGVVGVRDDDDGLGVSAACSEATTAATSGGSVWVSKRGSQK